jgi:hypothetical protein
MPAKNVKGAVVDGALHLLLGVAAIPHTGAPVDNQRWVKRERVGAARRPQAARYCCQATGIVGLATWMKT